MMPLLEIEIVFTACKEYQACNQELYQMKLIVQETKFSARLA